VSTLIVESPGKPGEPTRCVEVGRGQEVTFGLGSAQDPVDVPLEDPGAEPVAGRIRAADAGFWLITNLSRVRTYVVENDEGGGEYLRVPPGRLDMPIPFTCARVRLASAKGLLSLVVKAPEPAYLHAPDPQAGAGQMAAAFLLDENAKYFLVLVALCEPRLRDAASMVIPNTSEITRRLQRLAGFRGISSAAVNFHIRYLAGKLQIRQWPGHEPGARADWQREAIVSRAIRFGLAREEHLRLLG
jgi:hypothetical protein